MRVLLVALPALCPPLHSQLRCPCQACESTAHPSKIARRLLLTAKPTRNSSTWPACVPGAVPPPTVSVKSVRHCLRIFDCTASPAISGVRQVADDIGTQKVLRIRLHSFRPCATMSGQKRNTSHRLLRFLVSVGSGDGAAFSCARESNPNLPSQPRFRA